MVAITATSSATPPTQAWQGQARVAQARREADQAEGLARQLRSQANQAEQEASKGQARVSALSAQVAQTDNTYSAQVQQQKASSASRHTQAVLAPVAAAAGNQFGFPANPLRSGGQGWTASLQRPSSGRLVNLTA
jgi:phage repressor protein C with HTH and peptisase S24 domain